MSTAPAAIACAASRCCSPRTEERQTSPTSKMAAAALASDEDETDEEPWRQLWRRRRQLHFCKLQAEYVCCVKMGADRPPTPRADDRRFSRKQWRLALEKWMRELQNFGGPTIAAYRFEKRVTALAIIKNTMEYAWCSRAGVAMPTTPRAEDASISKREWERAIQTWRHQIRDLSATVVHSF